MATRLSDDDLPGKKAGLIVPPATDSLIDAHVIWLDEFEDQDLDGLLLQQDAEGQKTSGYLLGQLLGEVVQLRDSLDQALPILTERLVGPLAARLRELGFRCASLVSCGRLSLLPIHSAGSEALNLTYIPSARALQAAREAATDRAELRPVILGIGNPLPSSWPLAFARAEVEEIATQFAPDSQHLLIEREATRATLCSAFHRNPPSFRLPRGVCD